MTPTDTNEPVSVRLAEHAVNHSITQFEDAMEQLAHKIEDTTQRVLHILEVSQKSIEDVVKLKDRVLQMAAPLIDDIKRNPRPYLLTVAIAGAGIGLLNYIGTGSSRRKISPAV